VGHSAKAQPPQSEQNAEEEAERNRQCQTDGLSFHG
jgi:hypothetical protein